MKKRSINIPQLVIVLALIAGVAATLLSAAYLITQKPILIALQKKTNTALIEVLPEFDNQPSKESISIGEVKYYVGRKDGQIVGFAGETITNKGYNGDITVLAGLLPDGTLTTVLVIKQAETPGLGSNVSERKHQRTISKSKETGLPPNPILDQFSGMKAKIGQCPWKVKHDGGTLDAVTGATITSRAIAGAVFTIAETFITHRDLLMAASNI